MSGMQVLGTGRWLARFAAAALLLAVALWMAAGSAAAHSDLVSSAPADGAQLSTAPVEISLVFNEAISDAGLQLVATGPGGPVALGTPMVSGTELSAKWPSGAPAGSYTVGYRVVSADGHPIDGAVRFSYVAASSSDAALGRGQSALASPPPSEPSTATSASNDSAASIVWWVAVVVVLAGVAIGAGVAYTLRAKGARRHGPGAPPEG